MNIGKVGVWSFLICLVMLIVLCICKWCGLGFSWYWTLIPGVPVGIGIFAVCAILYDVFRSPRF